MALLQLTLDFKPLGLVNMVFAIGVHTDAMPDIVEGESLKWEKTQNPSPQSVARLDAIAKPALGMAIVSNIGKWQPMMNW